MPLRFSIVFIALITGLLGVFSHRKVDSTGTASPVYLYWQYPLSLSVLVGLVITIAVDYVQQESFANMDTTGFVIVLAGAVILLRLRWTFGFVVNNSFLIGWAAASFIVGVGQDDEEVGKIIIKILVVAVAHFVFLKAL